MIKIDNLSYSFAQKELYQMISFTIKEKQHCAFIGTSGTGKSTLVNMIMNPDEYMFDGTLEISSGCRIGYVSQFSSMDQTKELTVFEYIAEDFLLLKERLAFICTKMETSSELELLMEEYQQALDAFEAIGEDDFESNITKQLNLAKLNKHADLMVSKLSGGEFKLVQVMKEMLTMPDLIIMDEPDVFLDFENLNALKDLLNSHKGMLLVITHNRYLLNHCFNKIIHLENTELQEFDGTYADYNFSLLQKKIELQELAHADAEEIERNKKMVDKLRIEASIFTCASRGKSLNARVSLLERLKQSQIKAPFVEIKQPQITFPISNIPEDTIILNVNDYTVAFDDTLLDHVTFQMKAKDKVAIVGPNGTGKTTLLRDIYKNHHKSIQIQEDAAVVFLSQIQGEMLNETNTIEDEFLDAGLQTYDEVQDHLQSYGIKKDVMKQTIGSLSGGEKTLLQLAKIAVGKADLLLLDEPSSHLDTYSQIALEQAVENYKGAVLMISHDFYSIINCVDYVLLIEGKTIRKLSMRSFRKMIYAKHFNKDYLEIEQKRNALQTKIQMALKEVDFPLAKVLSEELETLM